MGAPTTSAIRKSFTREYGQKTLGNLWDCDPRRLAEVITGDETWVYYSTPYSKYKMRSWVKGDERPAQIPKYDFRKPKVMYTTFFNSGGISLQLPCASDKCIPPNGER